MIDLKKLPIHGHKKEIVSTIRTNQATIVVGETGSGKTTQLPLYLYEACFSERGTIGITEPRRIAAMSVAQFVAEQLGTKLGDVVGYQVRFDDRTENSTKIKFMTGGILLREFQADSDLSQYSVIMVDEAHERSANIDFTLGLLKDLLRRRPDFKVVVSSATIDAEKFSNYFGEAPIIEVFGRTYSVDIIWSDNVYHEWDMVNAVVEKIVEIHKTMPWGDILVFMTGADDINKVVNALKEKQDSLRSLIVLPVHGGLSPDKQQLIFKKFDHKRKVVVATNIAETSITIDGIVYVVDSGLIKQTHFHSDSGIQSLDITLHSQAGCDQRAGRAGRTCPGKCFRMFTEKDFRNRLEYTEPEIRRMSLAGVVLAMKAIGVKDIENFDFVDPPDASAFHEAYQTLIALGAITDKSNGLTDLGREMAKLPLEPRISRMVLEAEEHGCVEEIVTIAAFLSVRNVFVRPKGEERKADIAHGPFCTRRSDMLTFLKVWASYRESGFNKEWCFANFLNSRSLFEVKNIRIQLLMILRRRREISSATDEDIILRSVTAGLVQNLLEKGSRYAYNALFRGLGEVFIHPGSSLFGYGNYRWVVASSITETSKLFARGVSEVKVEWLPEIAPSYFYFSGAVITSYASGNDHVSVTQRIMRKGSEDRQAYLIGHVEKLVSIEEALLIQKKRIKEAERDGLVLAKLKRVSDSYDGTKMIGLIGSIQYEVRLFSDVTPKEEGFYYCVQEKSLISDGTVLNSQFRVFNLPRSREVVVAEEEQPTTTTTAELLQAGLGKESFLKR